VSRTSSKLLSLIILPSLLLVSFSRPLLAEEPAKKPPVVGACGDVPAEMACVSGGVFIRGDDSGPKNERPQATVFVNTFLIDKYEVTAFDYNACVKVKKCARARTNYRGFSRPRQPKLGVSWFQARAYCRAQGKRLPTEAEWEKAARGPKGERYPWGNQKATCSLAVIKDRPKNGCGTKKTFAVASRPAGRYGLYDMAGNAWEWVADWYAKSYQLCGAACMGPDPKGPCAGADRCKGYTKKIVKGGSWYWPAGDARGARRRPHRPSNKPYHHFGFRCAKNAAK